MRRITFYLSCRRVAAYSARLRSKDLQLEDNRCLICAVMWDEVKADRGTVMNLYEMSCPALSQSQAACNHAMDHFLPFNFFFTLTLGHPKPLASHVCQLQSVLFLCKILFCFFYYYLLSNFIRYAGGKLCWDLIRGFPMEYLVQIPLSGLLLSSSSSGCWHIFLIGLVQTLQGAAMSQRPSLKRPQQITAQGREEWGTGGGAIRELQSVKDKRVGVFKRTTPSPVTAQHRVHQSRQHSL